jgi:hypothetical protein
LVLVEQPELTQPKAVLVKIQYLAPLHLMEAVAAVLDNLLQITVVILAVLVAAPHLAQQPVLETLRQHRQVKVTTEEMGL